MSILDIPLQKLVPDPDQPRKAVSESEINERAQSLKTSGQLVPIIAVKDGELYLIVDGWLRWLAAKVCGMTTLRAFTLEARPSPADLLSLQIVVNCARSDLSLFDRFQAYKRLMELDNLSATDLAKRLSVSKGTVTRMLSIGLLSQETQELIRDKKISSANAYALARMASTDRELAVQGLIEGTRGRTELEHLAARSKQGRNKKIARVCCELPDASILVRGDQAESLDGLVQLFEQLVRTIRKAKKEGYDVTTLAQVLKVKARSAKQVEATT